MFDTSWVDNDAAYFLREVDSNGKELWRQPPGGRAKRVLAEVPHACPGDDRPHMDFLFGLPDRRLGIGVDCGDATDLLAFQPQSRQLALLGRLPHARSVTVKPGSLSGYVQQTDSRCFSVAVFQGDKVDAIGEQLSVGGRTWGVSTLTLPREQCRATGKVDAPALLPDNRSVALLASPPINNAVIEDSRSSSIWYLVIFDEQTRAFRQIGGPLEGAMDLAISPDGRYAAVAIGAHKAKRIVLVDLATGERKDLLRADADHLSYSPDGKRIAYSDSLAHLRFATLP